VQAHELLEKSRRSVEAFRKRMERLQKNIRRLYESRELATGNPTRSPRNPSRG